MKPNFPDLNKLEGIFEKYPAAQAVYLFGSAASGKTHAESDLDLGIVPKDCSAHAQKLDILTDLIRNEFNNIDLVFLDTKDIVVRFEAVRQNRLVDSSKEFDAGEFFSLTIRQYFDFVPYLKTQREAHK